MLVVLKQDVPNLGKAGEIKEVADRYARDYLLPHGYAVLATAASIKKAHERDEALRIAALIRKVLIENEKGLLGDAARSLRLARRLRRPLPKRIKVRRLSLYRRFRREREISDQQVTTSLDLKPAEAELLQKINQGLPSDLAQRYSFLIEKRDAEALTSDEHEELLSLTDQVEQLEAQRVAYLVELARLRDTTVTELIQELGITPSTYV